MTGYPVHPRHQIKVKGNRIFSFARYIAKNVGETLSKNLSSK